VTGLRKLRTLPVLNRLSIPDKHRPEPVIVPWSDRLTPAAASETQHPTPMVVSESQQSTTAVVSENDLPTPTVSPVSDGSTSPTHIQDEATTPTPGRTRGQTLVTHLVPLWSPIVSMVPNDSPTTRRLLATEV
jgi:hypothetical protein